MVRVEVKPDGLERMEVVDFQDPSPKNQTKEAVIENRPQNGDAKPKSRGSWVPYEGAWTETPFLCCLSRVLPYWYRCRNFFLRNPIVTARLPTIPFASRLPSWAKWTHHALTLGELFILIPAIALLIYFAVIGMTRPYPAEATNMSGERASYLLIFILAFASRNSILTFLLGVPYERQLFWHKATATVALVVLSWAHGIRAAFLRHNAPKYECDSGWGLCAFYTAFPILSFFLFRRKAFTIFYLVHLLLFLGAIIASITHYAYQILYGLPIWLFDVLFRYVYLTAIQGPKKVMATRLPANVIRLTFPNPKGAYKYSPGQYAFVMIPELNIFEWHPFSFSSAPHQEFVSVHIRVLGDWTKRLYDIITEKGGGPVEMKAYFEGPYGAPMIDIESDRYQLLLLISGGIGVTPLQSVANQLAYEHRVHGRPLKKMWFVWSVADKYMIGANFEHDKAWSGDHSPPRLPTSFQPDTLSENVHTDPQLADRSGKGEGDGSVLHTEFYLTRVRTQAELAEANIKPEFQPFLRLGRPDLPNIFATFAAFAESVSETRVGVMVCGPSPLVDQVRELCGRRHEFNNGPGATVRFDYHAEIFEF